MIPNAYTSPFCVPLFGDDLKLLSNSGAVHNRSEIYIYCQLFKSIVKTDIYHEKLSHFTQPLEQEITPWNSLGLFSALLNARSTVIKIDSALTFHSFSCSHEEELTSIFGMFVSFVINLCSEIE